MWKSGGGGGGGGGSIYNAIWGGGAKAYILKSGGAMTPLAPLVPPPMQCLRLGGHVWWAE